MFCRFRGSSSSANWMEETTSRFQHKDGSHGASRKGPTGKHCPCPADDSGDPIECSGKHCRSCTAGLIADCVAVCCCPCAVVSCFALAFLKAPWMMGRRCLGIGKKKRRRLENERECEKTGSDLVDMDGISEIGTGLEGNLSARFEAERVWLELYQVGHLGFGRVSFTGIPSQGKGN
ncbi:Chromo domain-containing protein isoform 1 [Actinidia chinensis var. chinensis]|uniref:Chromo domain-containing protein isoform 1 n=1 Tax=Actinidia chinensis var. chinensis TaxID=1590841 RepID=A0A2R6P982_ACTCC|nr:Chromo domain-containing protein isoform 1 [Actinidia chinensis var. chinensis]